MNASLETGSERGKVRKHIKLIGEHALPNIGSVARYGIKDKVNGKESREDKEGLLKKINTIPSSLNSSRRISYNINLDINQQNGQEYFLKKDKNAHKVHLGAALRNSESNSQMLTTNGNIIVKRTIESLKVTRKRNHYGLEEHDFALNNRKTELRKPAIMKAQHPMQIPTFRNVKISKDMSKIFRIDRNINLAKGKYSNVGGSKQHPGKIFSSVAACTKAGKVKEIWKQNQDSSLIELNLLEGIPNSHFLAVFDGHGKEGGLVSQFLTKSLPSSDY